MIEAGDAVLHGVARGQHQNGHALPGLPQLAAHCEAIAARNHYVENYQVVGVDRRLIQGVVAGACDIDSIGLFAQAFSHESRNARIVFGKQQAHASIIRQVRQKVRLLLPAHDSNPPCRQVQ